MGDDLRAELMSGIADYDAKAYWSPLIKLPLHNIISIFIGGNSLSGDEKNASFSGR